MNYENVELSFGHLIHVLSSKLAGWVEGSVAMLPNIVIASLLLFLFYILGRFFAVLLERVLARLTDNPAIIKLLAKAGQFLVVSSGFFTALGILHLDKAVTSLLAGAGVLGLALGFAFQEIAANFIAGFLIAFTKPYSVGDVIEVKNFQGRVDRMNLRTTVLIIDDGQSVLIPNKDVFTNPLKNYTSEGRSRLTLNFTVPYGADLAALKIAVQKALEPLSGLMAKTTPRVVYMGFNDLGVRMTVYMWMSVPSKIDSFTLTDDAILRITGALAELGIEIPTPNGPASTSRSREQNV
jgi:small conductance mechanosensitive channel